MPKWNLYLSDSDRNAGWTNHCYVLQYVCSGVGHTPRRAWEEALDSGNVPEGYITEEPPDVAIVANHERTLNNERAQ